VNLARDRMILQVALSSALDPLDDVIVQFDTRPLAPISNRKPVVPDSSARMAESG
jgi:hypothetical protein